MMTNICRTITITYAIACLGALLIVPLNASGAFGMQPDPLAGIFAILLATPWPMLTDGLIKTDDPNWNLVLVAAGMGFNISVLWFLCRAFSRKREDDQSG